MAIKIGSNFAYNGKLPNFERDSFETKAAMKAFDENSIDEGHISYCKEDGNIYQFKSSNTVDIVTGRWRIFKTDIVVDAALNGTSKNPIQNKAVFDALKLKADAVALDKYQPKYKADYIAKADFNYSELALDVQVVDLNGYTMTTNKNTTVYSIEFYNGTIRLDTGNQTDGCEFHHVNIDALSKYEDIDSIYEYCTINRMNSTSATAIKFSTVNNTNFASSEVGGVIFTIIKNSTFSFRSSEFLFGESVIIDDSLYKKCYIKNNKPIDKGYESNIDSPTISGNAPSCEAVNAKFANYATKTELNGKADKTQLNNYVTTATANTTYAKKSDITNIYKFKGTKTNYADLPTTNRVTGDVWNITNADAEHGIKAGDNVAWNGTAWDNLSGTVDLSAYATKDKAFTKDTVSTEPNQFLAGPINTRGNLHLRKIDISDIPDLRSKYQALDLNGFQYSPKMAGVFIGFGLIIDNIWGYFRASIPQDRNEKNSPDWYFATDGTLQDIKTKIPKVTLDNAVSTTSTNGVENQAITQYVDSKVTVINSSIADVRTFLESTQTDFVDLRNKVNAMPKTVFITQAAYNALTTKDANTIYYING